MSTGGSNLSNELREINVGRGTQRTLASAKQASQAAFFGSVAWSPNGRQIAVTRSRGLYGAEIDLLNAATGAVTKRLLVGARLDSGLTWTADGSGLYFAQQPTDRAQPTLRRVNARSGRVAPLTIHGLDPQARADGALAFSTTGGIVVMQHGRRHKVTGSRSGDRFPAWLPGGKLLLVERPAPSCPRYIHPVCSGVVILAANGGSARSPLKQPARNPTTR